MILFDPPSLESLLLPTCIGNSTIDCVLTVDDPFVIISLSPMFSEQGLIERYDDEDMMSCSKPMHVLECGVDKVISPDFMLIIGKKMMDELPSCVCLAVLKKVHNPRPNSGLARGS